MYSIDCRQCFFFNKVQFSCVLCLKTTVNKEGLIWGIALPEE